MENQGAKILSSLFKVLKVANTKIKIMMHLVPTIDGILFDSKQNVTTLVEMVRDELSENGVKDSTSSK